jgi:hypothetical protein
MKEDDMFIRRKSTGFLGCAVLIALTGLLSASRADEDFVPDVRQYPCGRAAHAIAIDGRLDDAAWKDAPRVTCFYDTQNDGRSAPIPREQIAVSFLYDETNLYVGAVIRDRDIVYDPEHLNKDKETLFLDGDVFELFVQPDANSPRYFEIHVNPNNAAWDAAFPARNYMRFLDPTKWNSGLKSAVTVRGTANELDEDESWTVEMAVPLSALADRNGRRFAVQPGALWRFSVCLYDYSYYYDDCGNNGALKYYSSSKYPRLDFHLRGAFNFLEFK